MTQFLSEIKILQKIRDKSAKFKNAKTPKNHFFLFFLISDRIWVKVKSTHFSYFLILSIFLLMRHGQKMKFWMFSTTFGPLVDHNSYLKQIFTWCRKFKMMCFLILKKIVLIRYFQKTPFEGSFCQICWFFDGCWHFWISRKLAFDSPEAIVTWSINHFLGVKSWNFSTL